MNITTIPALVIVTLSLSSGHMAAAQQMPPLAPPLHTPTAQPAPAQAANPALPIVVKVGDKEYTANLEYGRKTYETCAVCHSPLGWGTPSGRYPQVAGQHPNVIVKQLHDIRSGNRDNPTMYPFTQPNILPNEQAIVDVAAYISRLKMNPNNSKGSGMDLQHGERLYKENCVECHKANGEGSNADAYPRIQGQDYHYLLRQMLWIQSGKRRNADVTMVKQIHRFSGRDINAVIDYASRLKPDPAMVAESNQWWNPDFRKDFRSVIESPITNDPFASPFVGVNEPPPAPPGFNDFPAPPDPFGQPLLPPPTFPAPPAPPAAK